MTERDIDRTRRCIGMGLVAAGVGISAVGEIAAAEQTQASGPLPAAKPMYLVVYRHGARWVAGKPMAEQGLGDHFRYWLDLYGKGSLRHAGPFTDESGGAAMFEARDDAEANAILAADPAVTAQLMTFDLRRWKLQPWAEIASKAKP